MTPPALAFAPRAPEAPPDAERPAGLDALRREVARDLARLNYPPAPWTPETPAPDGRPALDALIVGAGMCGQTSAFALAREGVRRVRAIDRAKRGEEGPWGTYARMETLRSPKHINGPDLGLPSLTFRAYWEALNGSGAWDALYKTGRLDWRDYLLFVRDLVLPPAGIAVENEVELAGLDVEGDLFRATLRGPAGDEVAYAREVVLATGREGGGGPFIPAFPSLDPDARHRPDAPERGRVFHSSDPIDFHALRGRRVAVLGASASAFDNAGAALEAGAAAVVMHARRAFLPQVNKSRGLGFSGFQRGFVRLDDETRWRFLAYGAREQAPPPHESVLRCDRHANFQIRFNARWRDVRATADGVRIDTAEGVETYDAVIFGTGFSVELGRRPELAAFEADIATWGDRVRPELAAANPDLARFPSLDEGFAFTAKPGRSAPHLKRLRLFNHGATVSHGALAGDVPGLGVGAARLGEAVAASLFLADASAHYDAMLAFEEPELQPTRYFVPREARS